MQRRSIKSRASKICKNSIPTPTNPRWNENKYNDTKLQERRPPKSKHRGTTLLSAVLKIILNKLDNLIENSEEQMGFRTNRSTTDAIFVVRQVCLKSIECVVCRLNESFWSREIEWCPFCIRRKRCSNGHKNADQGSLPEHYDVNKNSTRSIKRLQVDVRDTPRRFTESNALQYYNRQNKWRQ